MATLTLREYDIVILTVSWLVGFAPVFARRSGWTWARALGLALLASPFVRMAVDFADTVLATYQRYQQTGTVFQVLQPVPALALWNDVAQRLLWYAVLPLLGLLLLHDTWSRGALDAAPEIGEEHGLAPRHSWRRDAARGLALFFAIAIAYVAAYGVDRLVPTSAAGSDESQYWRNVTIPLILLLSAASGLTEEFLFRGVLLSWLQRRMPWLAAAVAQALLFALIHAGYGSWTHMLGPFVFGLGMAWVARVLGVLPAALLHAQVNVLFFTFDVAPGYIAANGALGALALAAMVLALAAASAWASWRTRADAVRLMWRSLSRGFAAP